jgi:hypothetical protein
LSNKSRYFLVPIATAVATLLANPNASASSSNHVNQASHVVAGSANDLSGIKPRPELAQLISSEEIHSLTLSNSEQGVLLASHRSHSSHSSHSSHRSHYSSR